jgi:hypothetical protein
MMKRCYRKDKSYNRYGGRGIKVAERWHKFDNFFADMGTKPEGLTLERINNDEGYCKENCCWAPWEVQRSNKGLYSNNTSGINGVLFDKSKQFWIARTGGTQRTQLYGGPDFFEACCARKSWEAEQARRKALKPALSEQDRLNLDKIDKKLGFQ